jgi:hypothetical protein
VLSVCLRIPSFTSIFEWLNQSSWNLVYIMATYLKGVIWCICMCILSIAARQRLAKLYLSFVRQRQQHKNCWKRHFLSDPCLIKREAVGCVSPASLQGNNSATTFPRQIKKLLKAFSMWSVQYRRKVGDYFLPKLVIRDVLQLSDSNKIVAISPRWVLDTKTDWPTDHWS